MCPLLISQILNPGVNILCYFLNALSVLGIFNSEWTHSEHIGGGDAKGNEFFSQQKKGSSLSSHLEMEMPKFTFIFSTLCGTGSYKKSY